MKIVVVGAGKMGTELCSSLSQAAYDVTLIEERSDKLEQCLESLDIRGICGNGSFYEIQKSAGVDECDMFIAVTGRDELNIISCIIAGRMGAKYTVARVRTPEYSEQMDSASANLGISLMINPEREAAREVFRSLQFPAALSVEPFAEGRINMIEMKITENSPLKGMNLINFRKEFPGLITCVIQENEKSIIPQGNNVLKAGQLIFVLGVHTDLRRLYDKLGGVKRIKNVIIVGGGRISRYILDMHRNSSKHIKVIEHNEQIARGLADEFKNIEIILGDGTDQAILKEENLESYDCLIAMTGIDEENIILSMFADAVGVSRTITKINRNTLIPIAHSVGVQTIITPINLGATAIIRYVRSISNAASSSNIEALYRLPNSPVEVMQFFVRPSFLGIGKPIMDIKFKNGVLVAIIVRNNKIIIPSGHDRIEADDKILLVSQGSGANELNDFIIKEENN